MLEAEGRALWDAAGGPEEEARTFFIKLSDKPRCGLERLALSIVRAHYPTPRLRREVVGAEFWVQLRSSGDGPTKQGLEFHYDKDEIAVQAWDIWSHPELATATYLTGGGAPLVVFSTKSKDDGCTTSEEEGGETGQEANSDSAPSPENAWVCFPRMARHVAFHGGMLHGVPQELLTLGDAQRATPMVAPQPYTRLSFLVNVWTSHRPERVCRLPKQIAERLSRRGLAALPRRRVGSTPQQLLQVRIGRRPAAPWSLSVKSEAQRGKTAGANLHVLKAHKRGDTGFLPKRAVIRASRALPGPSSRGFIELRYVAPRRIKHSAGPARKRPAGTLIRT